MPFKYDELINLKVEGTPFEYNDTRMLLYNMSVGMGRDPLDPQELPFVFERPALKVVPSVASVLAGGGGKLLAGIDINWSKVLHGEQRSRFHRPFPASAKLIGASEVTEVVDKGPDKGAVITLLLSAKLENGEPLYETENVIFARGNGGCGGPSKSVHAPHQLPDRSPDFVHVTETRKDQALLYRLNADRNPLHADPEVAKKAGFPTPILHGLCSYGLACRALLATTCGYEPARMKTLDVRFTSPVFPGETIHTDIWVDSTVVSFRCRVEARGIIHLNNGRCELHG